MDPDLQRLQAANAQYPPPPSNNDAGHQNAFAQSTAAAALQSDHQSHQYLIQQQQQPLIATAPNPRKRKPAIPGSRGVANLTTEQLTKKRANDREAQRAIRERTKNTINSLESRIRELESQQPYQEMQRAIVERDRALAECEELRRRLDAVAGIVGNQNLGQMGLNQLAALTAAQSPLPPLPEQAVMLPEREEALNSVPEEQPNIHPDLRVSNDIEVKHPTTPD